MALLQCTPFPLSFLFRRHLYYCQNFPILFQRSGVGRAHKRQLIQGLICHAKNLKKMYKILSHGYTVSRKAYSTTTESYIRQQSLTYLFLIRKIYFPKDTRFFTASHKDYEFSSKNTNIVIILPHALDSMFNAWGILFFETIRHYSKNSHPYQSPCNLIITHILKIPRVT